ncbi:Tetratricopeptide repeat protein 16 [Geranomyces variabilis]|nr:Tetratricopeptide repeat protein 16 [Geranomyces variabilis]
MAEAKTPYRPQTTPLVRPGVQMVEDRAQEYDTRGHAASEDPAAAIASFSRAIHLLPDEPTFYWHRGEAYLKVLDFESAIANFRQHGVLVNTLRTTTAWERSLLVRPLTADSGSFDYPYGSHYVMQRRLAPVVYTWGQCLLDRKRFQEALKMFEYAASLGMKMESILLRCVLANIGLGLYETALEILYKLTEGTSDNIELFILRAKIYKHLGNVESTHLDVQRSIKINPDHPELPELLKFTLTTAIQYKNRASYQMLQGSPNVAIQYLTYAMDLDPDDWMLYLKRGALLADIAQYDCAIQDLERVLQQPDLSTTTVQEVRDKLARIHIQIGLEAYHHYDLVGAVHTFTTALDYQPQDPGTWKKRGDCYLALRNLPNSIADFAKAVELNPDDIKCRERCALLWATIADKLLADGEWTLSIEIWTTAINYNSTVAEYYFRRGRAFYMKECIDEARRDLYLARQLDPDNIEISAMLSQLTSGPPLLNTTPFPAQRIVKQSIPVALIPANEPGLVEFGVVSRIVCAVDEV